MWEDQHMRGPHFLGQIVSEFLTCFRPTAEPVNDIETRLFMIY